MYLEKLNKLSFLLVQCVAVVLSASYYQREYSGYMFTIPGFNDAEKRSQSDAQLWCNQNGSKLLAIKNSGVQNAVVMFINDAIRQNQFTGNTIITDGKRTNGNLIWINQTTNSPLEVRGMEGGYGYSFVYLYTAPSGFTLFADVPTDNYNYICEGQIFCGFGYQTPQGQCFQSFSGSDETVSWFEARNRCLERGGDLATFEFISTNDGLNNLNGSWINPLTRYWIGLRRQWWTWQSINSDVTYSQWSVGDPVYDVNQECLCFVPIDFANNNWKWSECQCSQIYQFICISSSDTTRSTTNPPTTSKSIISASFSSFQSSSHPTTQIHPSNAISPTAVVNSDNTFGNGSSILSVGLGVGLGIGIPALLIILILVFLLIRLRKKIRKAESKLSAVNRETTVPAYESLQREAATSLSPAYQELSITSNGAASSSQTSDYLN